MQDRPYVQTYTAVVGNRACNANCPYCISKMTPCHREDDLTDVNWRNFEAGARLARQWGASTFLITSKGEATLIPTLVENFIISASPHFPVIELQTNGLRVADLEKDNHLTRWYEAGLTTVALSAVHFFTGPNKALISDRYPPLAETIKLLKGGRHPFCVRLSIIMTKGLVSTVKDVEDAIKWAAENGVDQLKLYPVTCPKNTENKEVKDWVEHRQLFTHELEAIHSILKPHTVIRQLVHGDTVYAYKTDDMETDQNVAFGSCLTESEGNDIRQLIYCRDGHVRTSWQYNAAILF